MRISDVLNGPVLVTRDSARQLATSISGWKDGSFEIDFSGVEALTPSFMDELFGVVDDELLRPYDVRFLHVPTRLTSKYLAISRGRNITITELTPGLWEILGA